MKGTLDVAVDGSSVLTLDVDLASYANASTGLALIGFTASSGEAGGEEDIDAWSYEFLGQVSLSTSYADGPNVANVSAGMVGTFYVYVRSVVGWV